MKYKFTLLISLIFVLIAGFLFVSKSFLKLSSETYTPADFSMAENRLKDQTAKNTYIIRNIGSSQEVWQVSQTGEEIKLFSGNQIYSIKVSPDDHYLTIDINGQDIKLFNISSKEITSISREQLTASDSGEAVELLGWSADSNDLWGGTFFGYNADFFRMNIASNKIDKFGLFKNYINISDYALNPNTGIFAAVVFSQGPSISDQEIDVKFIVRNLFTDREILITEDKMQIIDGFIEKFEPKWLDDETLEYSSPDGSGRKVYDLPNNFILNN